VSFKCQFKTQIGIKEGGGLLKYPHFVVNELKKGNKDDIIACIKINH
jgi:hypothetical protein